MSNLDIHTGHGMVADLSVRTLTQAYRNRSLSPVEVLAACLDRVHALNPLLNALVTLTEEAARREAALAERQFATAPEAAAPLCGVPFLVKDTLPTAGVRTTFGSRLFADVIPEEDCAAVAALKRAGAILLGKTNTPTLGWTAVTDNKLFGPTPNPWDLSVTAGGSSGGAGAAALAGFAPINIGTDGGGSIRVPGSFTGTVGFKPSYGRVPNYPTGPNWGLQHIGPIARTVDDVALVLESLAVVDHRDPYSLPQAPVSYGECLRNAPHGLRLLFCPEFGYAEAVDPEVVTICRKAANGFADLGHRVTERIPGWSSPLEIWRTMFMTGAAFRLGPYLTSRPEDVEDELRELVQEGEALAPDAYYRAWLQKNAWWEEVRPIFDDHDLVLSPVVACPPFSLGRYSPGEIAGTPVSFYGWLAFTVPFNLTGQPAISVPAGLTSNGLPVGLQIIGNRFADDLVLAAAAAYERVRPWKSYEPSMLKPANATVHRPSD
jgi:aspartyl-tRNA(Asn)/glutamyl-tRNA(Gln) amidotransferase subunit A